MHVSKKTSYTTYNCCVAAVAPHLDHPHYPASHKQLLKQVCVEDTIQFYDYSVPADELQDVIVVPLNSTTIKIQWSPPLIPNSIITFYTIYINDMPVLNVSGQNSSVVGGFAPHQLLYVRLSASTEVGEGPWSECHSVTTHESGRITV